MNNANMLFFKMNAVKLNNIKHNKIYVYIYVYILYAYEKLYFIYKGKKSNNNVHVLIKNK